MTADPNIPVTRPGTWTEAVTIDPTERWAEGAEELRKRLHPGSTASLWGKDPNPPRGPKKLFDLDVAWYAKYSAHNLEVEAGPVTRKRTLDFFIAWRPGLTAELIGSISGVVFDGERYATAAEPRAQKGSPRFLRVICSPTGETA